MNPALFRFRRNALLKLQLSAALMVAGFGSLTRPSESIPRLRGALKTWFRWGKERNPAPFWVFYMRMRACKKCPFFYPKLATCGSPLAKNLQGVGCWCHLPTKASIIHADCYLRELGIDDENGWPDAARRLSACPKPTNRQKCKCSQRSDASPGQGKADGDGADETSGA